MGLPLSLRVTEAEARVYRRTWRGSVFSSFLIPILYLLAMGVGLGSLVDANLPAGLEGVSYLAYLAPGLLVATAMQTGATEGSWKVLSGVQYDATWKARLATPIGASNLIIGHIIWSAVRVLTVSAIFAVVMTAFRAAPLLQSFGAIAPAMLVGIGMAGAATALTVRLDSYTGIPLLFRFVVIPLFLFSGVFFPITNLPGWLQPVAIATPMYHGVELARAIVVNTTPAITWWVSVMYLTAWIIVGTYVAIAPVDRKLKP